MSSPRLAKLFGFLILISLSASYAPSIRASEPAPVDTAIRIAGQKQLFMDDYVVESMDPRVFRLLSQPLKYQENPVIPLSGDWEQKGGLSHGGDAGQIFYDEERQLYRFYGWMIEWPPVGGEYGRFLFYAESNDGIRWRKPLLGQVQYLGFDTNFIHLPFTDRLTNVGVFRDPAARSEEERYKMVFHRRIDGGWGLFPAYSADGLHWKAYEVDRPIVPFYSDTNNNVLWDAKQKRYVLYLRTMTRLDRWFEPEPIFPEGQLTRTPAWATSDDFLNWEAPRVRADPDERFVCFHADEKDPVDGRDFYTLEVLPYEGGYVGFTSVYHNYFGLEPAGMDSGNARSPWVDTMDVQLLWSRDGKKFHRMGERRTFLPRGPEGSWDEHLIYVVQAPIVRRDLGEIWIYYEGFSGHHWFNQRGEQQRGQVGLAILRLDGFVSVTGIGTITTKPIVFEGNQLTINATGFDKFAGEGYGTVKVEIVNAETGEAFPGFAFEDCDTFGGDSVSHVVSWRGRTDLGTLEGQPLQVRFHLQKAKLFSFQFVQ